MAHFPQPRFVELLGLTMAIHEQGPADGVPVVLCHGWPETGYAWRRQIGPLAAAGYRVIVPDMRGYGRTAGPKGPEAQPLYDMAHLTGDMAHLLDALGLPAAVFVGHDWGGVVAWQMPIHHPARTLGVVGVNTAYVPRPDRDPVAQIRETHGEDMYMVRFQEHGYGEAILGADSARSLRFIIRRSAVTRESWAQRPRKARGLALLTALQRPESQWPGAHLLDEAELRVFAEAFERCGWEGPLHWYRNLTRNWETSADLPMTVDVPALMVFAENDVVLPPSLEPAMRPYVPDLESHVIPNCGHWTQTEAPDQLNAFMLDWLGRRFPAARAAAE